MSDIRNELNEIRRNQRTIMRRIEFLLNAGIIFSATYNARSSESGMGKFFGILAASLAAVCQIILAVEDIKETIDSSDDEEIEADE